MASVEILRRFGAETGEYKKRQKLWKQIGERILKLPEWQQTILLDDLLTAVQSRLIVFEKLPR